MARQKQKTVLAKPSPITKSHLLVFALVFGLIGIIIWKSIAAPNPNLPGDLNGDNTVDATDLSILLGDFNTSNSAADINGDGTVDVQDLSILLSHYGQSISQSLPAVPTGLTATPGDGSVSLQWNANAPSDNVDTYQVYWTTDSTWSSTPSQNLNVSVTSYTVSGLTNGTTYYFRVSAHNAAGYGNWSAAAVSATPQSSGGGGGGTNYPGIGIYALGDSITSQTHLNIYRMIVVDNSASEANLVCGLPSPALPLIYFAGSDVNQNYNTGVDWNTANANGWLLKDASGNLLVNQGYPNDNVPDVGLPAYQQAWISNVESTVRSYGCKGVFIDDVLRDIKSLAGEYPAKYPDQASWETAMVSFVNAVGTQLKKDGFYVGINASAYTAGDPGSDNGSLEISFWKELGPYVNGIMDEYYAETSDGKDTLRATGTSNYTQYWDQWQQLIPTTQNMGDDFIGLTYSSGYNTQVMRYGKGSFLLEWNGGGSMFSYSIHGQNDYYNAAWTTSIGTPTTAKTEPQTGVWQRSYSGGQVIVNSTTSTVTVSGHTIAGTDAYIGP